MHVYICIYTSIYIYIILYSSFYMILPIQSPQNSWDLQHHQTCCWIIKHPAVWLRSLWALGCFLAFLRLTLLANPKHLHPHHHYNDKMLMAIEKWLRNYKWRNELSLWCQRYWGLFKIMVPQNYPCTALSLTFRALTRPSRIGTGNMIMFSCAYFVKRIYTRGLYWKHQ